MNRRIGWLLVTITAWKVTIPADAQVPKMWDDAAMATLELPLASILVIDSAIVDS